MTLREAVEGGLQSAVSWVFVGLIGGVWWLIRRVFTNQKQIETLQTAIQHRDEQRRRDTGEFRDSLKRLEETQKELREDVKKLFQR